MAPSAAGAPDSALAIGSELRGRHDGVRTAELVSGEAALMPDAVLAPGARIECRSAEWLVRSLGRSSDGQQVVDVVGVSPFLREKEARFLVEVEKAAGSFKVLQPEETELVSDPSPRYRDSLLFLEAHLRRSVPTDNALVVGQRAAMDALPYQLEPAAKALAMPRQRLLIADAVGLGKTLECGILCSELIRRGRGKRLLVVTSKSMLVQFQKEFWTRFSIPLVRLDSVGIQRIREQIPTNQNPFHSYDKAIVSVDTLKNDRDYRFYLDNASWDIIVIDECQNVAERARGAQKSQRARLAERLATRSETLILLSATPHDGKPESFASLMNRLDPTAIADPSTYTKDDIKDLYVRRFRKDVIADRRSSVKERDTADVECPASEREERVFALLKDLKLPDSDAKAKAGQLFKTTLAKSLLSSPMAALETVRNRLKRLEASGSSAASAASSSAPADQAALEELVTLLAAIGPADFSKIGRDVSALQQLPEAPLLAEGLPQPSREAAVGFHPLPVVDAGLEPLALAQVLGGIAVALGATHRQREHHHRPQQQAGGHRMVGTEALGGRFIDLVGVAIPGLPVRDHVASRPGQGRPEHQELQCRQGHGVLLGQRQGPLFRLHIGEVIEPPEVVAQQWNREGFAEHQPAVLLGVVAAAEGLKHGDAGGMPGLGLHDPRRLGGMVQCRQGLLGPAGLKQMARHLGGGGGPGELGGFEQLQVAVQVATAQRQLLHGEAIDATARQQRLLQLKQPCLAKNRCQGWDQTFELAITLLLQQLGRMLHQSPRVEARLASRGGEGGERVDAPLEQADHGTGGIRAAIKHPLAQLQQAHLQLHRQGGIGCGDRPADRLLLGLEVRQQCLAFAGIDEGGGTGDRRQPLAHLLRRPVGPAGGGQGQPQPPLDHGVAGAHFDQQLRQGRHAQRFEVLGIEGSLASHGVRCWAMSMARVRAPAIGVDARQPELVRFFGPQPPASTSPWASRWPS